MNDLKRAVTALTALASFAALASSGTALAADPPPTTAPTTPATAPDAATPVTTPATPASDAAGPQPAAPGQDERADGAAESEEDPAVPGPDTSPSAIFKVMKAGPGPAATAPEPDINRIDDGRMGTHQTHWLLGLGLRQSFIASEGFDLFSENNALPQLSLHAGRVLYANGPLSFAALVDWDFGMVEADARGADTELVIHRLTVGGEGRFHVLRRLYAFGRIAPGALNAATKFSDRIAGVDRESSKWGLAADFSLGAAVEFAGDARGASSRPRGFFSAEGGYGWAQSTDLTYEPEGDTTPVRLQPLSLGELAVRGAFLRVSALITY
jgi:hypothetical protein